MSLAVSLPRTLLRLALVLGALTLIAGLAGCGKRSGLSPPEGEESRYTYPRVYPDPGTVVLPVEEEPAAPVGSVPTHAGDISPFPEDRTKTRYQSLPVQ